MTSACYESVRMDNELKNILASWLLSVADDELLLGHRDSEWCGHAPILEEDIAFANLALDEIGHAALWYGLLSGLLGQEPEIYPDRLVYLRSPGEFRNVQLVELPNGDWAFTVLRQYLCDAAELARLERLAHSSYTPLSEGAAKIRNEEIYHYRHSEAWVKRLGLGTEESHRRMQAALNGIWPYTAQIFSPIPGEERLVEAGLVPPAKEIGAAWEARVIPLLYSCKMLLPEAVPVELARDQHTPHLKVLLAEMQSVAREEPEAEW